MKRIITSGGFDPIHNGHIEYLNLAKNLGDYLIVIMNNDNFLHLKKGYAFYPLETRKTILENLKCVDEVFISIDNDLTVCESIKEIANKYKDDELIFAKGGDRFSTEIPEAKICKELNIKIIDGLGEKIQSSSSLVNKPWGWEKTLYEGENFKLKIINVKPQSRLSFQSHENRKEIWTVVKGTPTFIGDSFMFNIETGKSILIQEKEKHRLCNDTDNDITVIELQLGICNDNDIIRYADDYNRI